MCESTRHHVQLHHPGGGGGLLCGSALFTFRFRLSFPSPVRRSSSCVAAANPPPLIAGEHKTYTNRAGRGLETRQGLGVSTHGHLRRLIEGMSRASNSVQLYSYGPKSQLQSQRASNLCCFGRGAG